MVVVADATPLRYLAVIGHIGLLSSLFNKILIPPAVWDELGTPSTPQSVRLLMESRPAWLYLQSPRPDSLDAVSPDLDEGERAAIALAVEVKADLVLIDEAAGRRVAKELGMRITGTVGVLRLAAERGMIDVPDVLSQLRASGFYIDENILRAAFEPWLRRF